MSCPPHKNPNSEKPVEPARVAQLPALSSSEVVGVATDLQELNGAQLQECVQTLSELGLGFYHERRMFWLWFDLNPLRPMVVRFFDKPPSRKKVARPFTLFMRSHFLGRRLEAVRADVLRGRILILTFHRAADEDEAGPCELEVRLFPHGQNIIATSGKKSVAEYKPKEIPESQSAFTSSAVSRSWHEIEVLWLEQQKSYQQSKSQTQMQVGVSEVARNERDWQRAIDKKEKAIARMREELIEKTSSLPSAAGEWLKMHRSLDVPLEYQHLIEPKRSVSWNIEECFQRAKDGARKAEGARARIQVVESELADLKQKGPSGLQTARSKEKISRAKNLLGRADARGRKRRLADDLDVYIGKSAADNLALLRKAQPFDYWLHLREQPGSHAIIRRTRTRIVSDAEFLEAGKWVVEQSTSKRAAELKGERFDLLIVECRFVRPIKGDKLGRVNYSNDRLLSLRF